MVNEAAVMAIIGLVVVIFVCAFIDWLIRGY